MPRIKKLIPNDKILRETSAYKETFRIILPSSLGQNNYGSNYQKLDFFFDWSVLPDRAYSVKFVFNAKPYTAEFDQFSVGCIQTDLFMSNSYIAGSNYQQTAGNCDYLGILQGHSTGSSTTKTGLYADLNTNPPIYISSRPRQNKFYIAQGLGYNPTLANGEFTVHNVQYTLILYFETL